MLFIQNTQFKSIKKHKIENLRFTNRINRLNNYILCSRYICIYVYRKRLLHIISTSNYILWWFSAHRFFFYCINLWNVICSTFFIVSVFCVFFFFYVAKDAVNGSDFYLRIIILFFIDTYGATTNTVYNMLRARDNTEIIFIYIYHLLFMLRKVVLETCGLFGRRYIYDQKHSF